ncbi:MAG: hypothetical protein JWP29_1377 [Rhodoferax sp.]|nr:hypothetical protein [Rhodoferax sp.]
MNTSRIISSALFAVVSLSATAAFAGDSSNNVARFSDNDYPPTVVATAPGLTRAEVRAAVLADAPNRAQTSDNAFPVLLATTPSHTTRAEVRAQLPQATHHYAAMTSDSAYPGEALGNADDQSGNRVVTAAPKASGASSLN